MKSKFAIGVLTMILLSISISFSQKTKEVKKTVDLNVDGKVYIDTYKGSITIETWEKSQVSIMAKIEPDGWYHDDERNVQETEIRIDDSPSSVHIQSDYDRLKRHHSHSFLGMFGVDNLTLPFVHYTITMPKTAKLEIKDYKSDSRITGLRASLRMETYKGNVTIENLEGSVNLETYKGKVDVDLAKLTGNSKLETGKGELTVSLASNAGCDLDVELGRKADFHSDFQTVDLRRHRNDEQFRATINGGGPELRIETEKGNVRLRKR
jgi:hypothetical protein